MKQRNGLQELLFFTIIQGLIQDLVGRVTGERQLQYFEVA